MSNPSTLLSGLDGSNPLAFLAALGTLRTLTLALPEEAVKMSWSDLPGFWCPSICCSVAENSERLISILHEQLQQSRNRSAFSIGDDLNLQTSDFHDALLQAVSNVETMSSGADRINADFLAAFGSDAFVNEKGVMEDTALRTMSGAGHQHFLKFFRELVIKTDVSHLERSLLHRWDYADDGRGLTLRWDPSEDRRYALRWDDPSGDPVKTMRGANRLAIEAMPVFATIPTSPSLATTAFEGTGARRTFFLWPIWSVPIAEAVVRSLFGNVRYLRDHVDERPRVGLSAMFSSARITTGKFRNFTPSKPI